MTTIKIYRNLRNENKFIEVHEDGHYHYTVRQFLKFPNGIKNKVGDGNLHRWRKENLNELLKDYRFEYTQNPNKIK